MGYDVPSGRLVIAAIVLVALIGGVSAGCGPKATAITLAEHALTLELNDTANLSAVIVSRGADKQDKVVLD